MMINCSFAIFGARSITAATACADSSAGMMPSRPREADERVQRLGISRVTVFDALFVAQPGVFRADRRVIQARRNAVG